MSTRNLLRTGALAATLLAATPLLAAEEAHGEPSIFAGSLGNSLVTLIVFGAVVFLLGKLAWKPVLNVLNERERTIRDSLESAKREREQAEQLLTEYKGQLDKARDEAAVLIDKGRQDAATARARILEDARGETTEMTARARREIQLATDAAIKELYDRTADLSVDVAARIIGKELSPTDHSRLIADSLASIRAEGKAKLN